MQIFQGIPYAHATRFAPPQRADRLNSLEQLTTSNLIAPQNPCRLEPVIGLMGKELSQGEDCLNLSVFTPSVEGNRPVMVFIHGGAYLTGSALFPEYDAQSLAEYGDIVVVNISYRLGALGFLYAPDQDIQNLGLIDQICALEWVQDNIHLFGGDPQKVTLMGQSAGANSIVCHIANLKKNLFQKAIIASNPFFKPNPSQLSKISKQFISELVDIHKATVSDILQEQSIISRKTSAPLPFCPIVENASNPLHIMPGLRSVMLWCQQDDAVPFVPYRWLSPIVTKFVFDNPMLKYAQRLTSFGVNAQTIRLSWRHDVAPFGATHCMELPLLFGNWERWKNSPMLHDCSEEEYQTEATRLKQIVANFVKQE